MTATIPSCEPSQFVAGDSVVWTRSLTNYAPADGWVLHYHLNGPFAVTPDPVVAVVNGQFQITLAPAATADPAFTAGEYRLVGWVDGVNSERHTIFSGIVEILPNVAVAVYASLLTHAERMVIACEAALEGRLTADVARYGREGAFIEKLPIEQITRLLGINKYKVWRQQNPGQLMPVHAISFAPTGRRGNPASDLASPGSDA